MRWALDEAQLVADFTRDVGFASQSTQRGLPRKSATFRIFP